jgi:hypothetical protein
LFENVIRTSYILNPLNEGVKLIISFHMRMVSTSFLGDLEERKRKEGLRLFMRDLSEIAG